MKIKAFVFYLFLIASFLSFSCDGGYSSSVYDKSFNTPPLEVTELTQSLSSSGNLSLSWKLPEDYTISKIRVISSVKGEKPYSTEDMAKRSSYSVYGLEGGKNYEFTVKTVNSKGIASSGVSISYTPNINTDLIAYKRIYKALDFGYAETTSKKTFLYTSEEDTELSLENMYVRYAEGSENVFSFEKSELQLLKPGESTNITVVYTPSSKSSWDEADLIISSDPEISIRLTGSGFKQPSDVQKTHLKLWLRTDLVSEKDFDSYDRVVRMRDYSGNGFDALAFNETVPKYKELEKLNNQPALHFEGTERLIVHGKIASYVDKGTTTFIVFQRDSSNPDTYFFTSANGTSTSFPSFGFTTRNFDENLGYSATAKYVHQLTGNGFSNSYRFYFDDSEDDDNMIKESNGGEATTICAIADFGSGKNSNAFAYFNGEKALLSWTGSTSSNSTLYNDNEENLRKRFPVVYRAYGKPWSDGDGKLYKALWNNSLENASESDKEDYYKGFGYTVEDEDGNSIYVERPRSYTHPTRSDDAAIKWWGFNSPTQYDWPDSTYGQSDWKPFYTNKLSTGTGVCNTISTVYLGTRIDSIKECHTYIASVIIYDTVLSDEEIKTVNNFIYYRYGVGKESLDVVK